MKIKICGLKEPDNILKAAALKPDYLGFIFYRRSPRWVGDDFSLPRLPEGISSVGVFVNETLECVCNKAKVLKLDGVQLHGDEDPSYCWKLKKFLPHIFLIKAFGIDSGFDFARSEPFCSICDFFLFDTKTESYGGSGKSFDWSALKAYQEDCPFFLGGGIGAAEVRALKSRNLHEKLCGVDLNSKIEISPGVKDMEKAAEIVKLLRDEIPG